MTIKVLGGQIFPPNTNAGIANSSVVNATLDRTFILVAVLLDEFINFLMNTPVSPHSTVRSKKLRI
jgi:hypothetical protein